MEILKNHVANYNKAMAEKKYSQVASIAEIIMNYCAKKLKENPTSQFAQTFKDKYNSAKEFYDNYKAGKYSNSNIAGNASNTERPKTNWFSDEVPNLKISDIAGLQKLKNEFIINIFAPFDPVYGPIYRKYRSDIGLQVLLYGPPGTGKTFAVKCLAGELGCKIAVVQVKDIMSKYVDRILGTLPSVSPSKQVEFTKMVYIYCRPGTLHKVIGLDDLKRKGIIDSYFLYKTSGMEIHGSETSGDRPAGYLVTAQTAEDLQSKLKYADSHIAVISDSGEDIMLHGLC